MGWFAPGVAGNTYHTYLFMHKGCITHTVYPSLLLHSHIQSKALSNRSFPSLSLRKAFSANQLSRVNKCALLPLLLRPREEEEAKGKKELYSNETPQQDTIRYILLIYRWSRWPPCLPSNNPTEHRSRTRTSYEHSSSPHTPRKKERKFVRTPEDHNQLKFPATLRSISLIYDNLHASNWQIRSRGERYIDTRKPQVLLDVHMHLFIHYKWTSISKPLQPTWFLI
ncbi:hypothetical protein BDD12DRAFT_126562 [Trichophaea hybrida]|nr:hypothetical protein BDD12DRAFT_126562 [Trichophaea hybrida]